MPKSLRLEALADNPRRAALLWGPLVLAGDLGDEEPDPAEVPLPARRSPRVDPPVLVAADRAIAEWLKPHPERAGTFRTSGVGRDREADLVPLYRLHRRTYAVYWDLFTPAEWTRRESELLAERARQRRLEDATVAFVQPGEMQAERDAGMQGEQTQPDRLMGRPGRRGSRWFSFDLPVDAAHPLALVATYNHDEWQPRAFRILVEGSPIAEQTLERRGPVEFFDVEYAVPAGLISGKSRMTVRFEALPGREIGCLYGLRLIRSDAPR